MSGASRVSIPSNLKKTIQDIKEIAGKHSDDDIYAMLKECSMDPNETAQKLLYLDTFHEVKSKRDRRKVTVNSRAYDGHRRTPGLQHRGNRGGRENYYTSNFDGAGGGRQVKAGPENGYNRRIERASKSYVPGPHKTESHESSLVTNSSTSSANSSASVFNGSFSEKSTSQLSMCSIGSTIKSTSAAENSKSGKMPFLQSVAVKQIPFLNPCPTPTPTPTRASTAARGARFEGGKSKSISSHLGNNMGSTSVSDFCSSASDPLLVSSLNPGYLGGVGIIKPETGKQRIAAQVSINNRMSTGQTVTKALAVSESFDSTSNTQPRGSQGVERGQLAVPPLMASSTKKYVYPLRENNKEITPVQGINDPSKDESASKQATQEVDNKLHKSHISARQSVIFPNHIHVPEAFKNSLTFGSLNVPLGQSNTESKLEDVAFATNDEAIKESSVIDQPASSTAGRDDYPDCPQSPPHVSDTLSPSQDNVPCCATLTYDQAKLLQPVGGSQNPLIPTMMDYSLSIVPPVIGPHLVQAEGLEPQGGKSLVPSTGSAPSVIQPAGIGQNTFPLSPQLLPYIRQPYPPNYIPYSPYLSQLYMTPPNGHQFLGNSGFPQQPSTGNIYMPPTATAGGVKFPVPSLCKAGTVGNLTHYGIPSGFSSYGASGVGYSPSAALAPGNSANNNDIVGSELKEKTIYSTIKQSEDSHAWTSAPGRDMSTLQANVFYNLPQGQHSIFPSQVGHGTFPGIYHPTQTLSMPPTLQSLPQQSQAVAGPLGAYLTTTIATSTATATCTDELEP